MQITKFRTDRPSFRTTNKCTMKQWHCPSNEVICMGDIPTFPEYQHENGGYCVSVVCSGVSADGATP